MRYLPALGSLLVAFTVLSSMALAQANPEFKLGFKALADQIPEVVGVPLEVEHYGPNGDSLQQTTTGLMVWRKADNWTAFTNGSRTWINGPGGVQERANGERFDWEEQVLAPPPAPVDVSRLSDAAKACVGCHPDLQAIAKATADYATPEGEKANPHTTIDPSITKRYADPHSSGQGVVDCSYCHKPHPVPLASAQSVPRANVNYCFVACHHRADFQPCKDCHR